MEETPFFLHFVLFEYFLRDFLLRSATSWTSIVRNLENNNFFQLQKMKVLESYQNVAEKAFCWRFDMFLLWKSYFWIQVSEKFQKGGCRRILIQNSSTTNYRLTLHVYLMQTIIDCALSIIYASWPVLGKGNYAKYWTEYFVFEKLLPR